MVRGLEQGWFSFFLSSIQTIPSRSATLTNKIEPWYHPFNYLADSKLKFFKIIIINNSNSLCTERYLSLKINNFSIIKGKKITKLLNFLLSKTLRILKELLAGRKQAKYHSPEGLYRPGLMGCHGMGTPEQTRGPGNQNWHLLVPPSSPVTPRIRCLTQKMNRKCPKNPHLEFSAPQSSCMPVV